MVLFRDDEKRMKAQEKAAKIARRSRAEVWIRRLFKITLIMAAVMAVSLWVLTFLGGSSDSLRNGIAEYMSQATGMETEIGDFGGMTFFPYLALDAANIRMRRPGDDAVAVRIDTLQFASGFFDMMFSRGRFRVMEITGLRAEPGVWGPAALTIDELALREDVADEGPGLLVKGRYGDNPLRFALAMDKPDGSAVYRMPDDGAFSLTYGDLQVAGAAAKAGWGGGVRIDIDSLKAPEDIATGTVTLQNRFDRRTLKAALDFGDSRVRTDLTVGDKAAAGNIVFERLRLEDLALWNGFLDIARTLPFMTGDDEDETLIDLYFWDIDLDVSIRELVGAQASLGTIQAGLTVDNQVLTLDLDGRLNGGDLDGVLELDALTLPARLTAEGGIKGWDFGQYQQAMFGRADLSGTAHVKWALSAEADTYPGLIEALAGEAALVAGEGRLAQATLNVWGAGLVNAMLPSLDREELVTLNCLIADFKLEDGIARPDPLFMDTARVTVVGEGEINLPGNRINLKLEPKAKNPALLDVATAVRVSGPILEPSVGADTFSLFEKLGGLALGVINPAFLAFSLTDLGLGDNHPCRAFIGGDRPEDGPEEDEPEEPETAEEEAAGEGPADEEPAPARSLNE